MAGLAMGCTILPQAVFDAGAALETISRESVAIMLGTPTIFHDLLEHPLRDRYDLSSLHSACPAAAHVPVELVNRMRDELGFTHVITGYGLTEATAHCTLCHPDDRAEDIASTVGRSGRDVAVAVVDDFGHEAPRGSAGEVWVRGYNVMSGYWEDEEATREAVDPEGWLHTGDVGTMDERGYLRIVDRLSDMLVVGGFNVYPAEVERVLRAHPDVSLVAVVGVPDARLGEVGVAFVVPVRRSTPKAESILPWARDRLAGYKVPRLLYFVDELPLGSSLKVQKRDLVAEALRRLSDSSVTGGIE